MAVCQFHLRGQCKFGENCRNEHALPAGGATSWGRNTAAGSGKQDLPYNAANIAQDLNPKGEKPIWPLSSYAPFKHETTLIGGLDVSPEELRVQAATAVNAGNVNEYIQYEANQIAAAERVYDAARSNMSQTFEQAVKQSKLVTNGAASTSVFPSTSFGSTTSLNEPTTSAFGKSAPGTQANFTTSAFGKPAFGQSAFGQVGFGQPAFGQSGFGQTSTTSTSALTAGQPSSTSGDIPSTTSAFGKSSFGQTNPSAGGDGSSSLIRPSSGAFSAFATSGPSAFGAGATPTSNPGGFSSFASGVGSAAGDGSNALTSFDQPHPQQTGNAFSALTGNNSNSGTVFGSFGAPTPLTETTTTTAPQPASVFGGGIQSTFGNPNTTSSQQKPVSAFAQITSNLNVTPSNLIPSISMASSNSVGSAFPASPMSTINATHSRSSLSFKTIDFSSMISRTTYRPGSTPYDSQLPQNYSTMLPERVNKAFKKERFTWAWQDSEASIPEWVPPIDVR